MTDVNVPKVGPVKKPVVIAVGVGAVAMVGYMYYRNRANASAAAATQSTDPNAAGYVDPGTIPAVAGAVDPNNLYGTATPTTTTTSDYGFTGTSNPQWSQYAITQLQQSDQWSYTDISTALGAFINNKPLTTKQQQIVQAAIAVAGYPPEGSHTIIPGGDTSITVAPASLRKLNDPTTTAITMQWNAVAGASHYQVFRTDLPTDPIGDSSDTKFTAQGLTPNKSYSFKVAAVTGSNQVGPKSNTYTAKTKSVVLATPRTPSISAISKSSAHATTGAVPNATGYNWYINNVAHGHSDGPAYTFQSLHANSHYQASVAADTATGGPSKSSGHKSFTTKK